MVQSHPTAGVICPLHPSLVSLQVTFCPVASGKLLSRPSMTLQPNMGRLLILLTLKCQSHEQDLHQAPSLTYFLLSLPTVYPSTGTSFSDLFPPTQMSSCPFGTNQNPQPCLPNKPQCPHRTSLPISISNHHTPTLSPPGLLLPSWVRPPSFLTGS